MIKRQSFRFFYSRFIYFRFIHFLRQLGFSTRALYVFTILALGIYPGGPTAALAAQPQPQKTQSDGVLKLANYLNRPKLVVVLVIDQFRADYLTRFQSRFLPAVNGQKHLGGFRYLMERGAYFPFAEYDHLQNMTCPGHAAILTGSYPHSTQIPINSWYDRATGKMKYCVADDQSQLVGQPPHNKTISDEHDSEEQGVSPRNLKTTTVGDELKNAGHPSRVMTVALKDRSAILLGGHRADLALWFDANSFRWISSRYYLPAGKMPSWVESLNSDIQKRLSTKRLWQAPKARGTGLSTEQAEFTQQIQYGSPGSINTPIGIELTTEAAIRMIKEYKLGQGSSSDILAVSYSTHDFAGHNFGPNSRILEELTIAEDQSFAELFRALNQTIPGGIKNVLIAMTADHGMAPAVNYLAPTGIEAGQVDDKVLLARANSALQEKFGTVDRNWILKTDSFNFYLNDKAAEQKKIPLSEVAQELKRVLGQEPSAKAVVTVDEIRSGLLPPGFERAIRASFVPGQSGDVILIPKPFFMTKHGFDNHMTSYSYDRSVPLILAGPLIKPGVYASNAKVVDLASTLSFLLGVLPPATAEGRVLDEVLAKTHQ